ncbi:phosphate regulon sensor protein PhoR [Litorivicinus sp.]|nr:phosphate regulon sensor protein PhoR [Litorivicinus sp.]
MRNATSTTLLELTWLGLLTIFLGVVTGYLVLSALFVSSTYLAVTLWRRNSFYRWLESNQKTESLITSDLWVDIIRRVEIEQDQAREDKASVAREFNNLRLALSSLRVGLVLTDKTWNLTWWNEVGGELLNLRQPDDINSYLFALLRSPALKEYIAENDFSEPLILDNFTTQQSVIELYFGDSPSEGYIILVRDISQLKRLNEMRSDFIANVSHELRTPLTVINGYLETLIDNQLVEGVAKNAIENAALQGRRMDNIIQDLITLSQLETSPNTDIEVFNLFDLVGQVQQQIASLQKNLKKDQTIVKILVTEDWVLTGNRNEIFSLLSNLLSNALRYCPDGSLISLRLEQSDHKTLICVDDNGPGIPEPHLSRVTERFYRVDKSHSSITGGTGLGLAIAKHIMERHSGSLQITSGEGKGTGIRCLFPKDRLQQIVT